MVRRNKKAKKSEKIREQKSNKKSQKTQKIMKNKGDKDCNCFFYQIIYFIMQILHSHLYL